MTKVDYVGVSFDIVWQHDKPLFSRGDTAVLRGITPPELSWDATMGQSRIVRRRPYQQGASWPQGFSVYWGGQSTVLVEVSGKGCSDANVWNWLASLHDNPNVGIMRFNKVTRLDIATDYVTDYTPFEWVSEIGINPRIKTRNVMNSQTGQTFYVGSRKSDRFCRVYSYNRPHPRAGTLRVEFQYGKNVAGDIVQQVLDKTAFVDDIYHASIRATFNNPVAGDAGIPVKITRPSARSSSGSVVWFYKQVAPALAKLIDAGEITQDEILNAITDKRKI